MYIRFCVCMCVFVVGIFIYAWLLSALGMFLYVTPFIVMVDVDRYILDYLSMDCSNVDAI